MAADHDDLEAGAASRMSEAASAEQVGDKSGRMVGVVTGFLPPGDCLEFDRSTLAVTDLACQRRAGRPHESLLIIDGGRGIRARVGIGQGWYEG